MPSRISRRMPWSISDFSALTWLLIRRQVLVLGPHHAPAKLGGDGLGVARSTRVQPLARRHLPLPRLAEARRGSAPARRTKHSNSSCSLFLT